MLFYFGCNLKMMTFLYRCFHPKRQPCLELITEKKWKLNNKFQKLYAIIKFNHNYGELIEEFTQVFQAFM